MEMPQVNEESHNGSQMTIEEMRAMVNTHDSREKALKHLGQGARIFLGPVLVSVVILLLAAIGLYFTWDPSFTLFRALNTWLGGEDAARYNAVPTVDQVPPLEANRSSANANPTQDTTAV